MAFETRADLQYPDIGWLGRDAVLLALGQRFDFPDFGSHLGNIDSASFQSNYMIDGCLHISNTTISY